MNKKINEHDELVEYLLWNINEKIKNRNLFNWKLWLTCFLFTPFSIIASIAFKTSNSNFGGFVLTLGGLVSLAILIDAFLCLKESTKDFDIE